MDQSKMLESRVYQINELENYANYIENELRMVANQFGLKDEDIKKYTNMRLCPYDNGHSVPITSYEKHIKNCAMKKMGYSEEDFRKVPPSSKFYYENNPDITTIVIDNNLQSQILYQAAQEQPFSNGIEGPRGIRGHPQGLQNLPVPLTNDRSITDLTEAERLAIYDYVIRCSKSDTKSSELTLEDLQFSFELQNKNKEGKPKSKLEILAELRDYKRRRQSYRAKNVHITKKSYTEVMKEVISNMTVFLESMNESTEPKTEEIDCPSTSRVDDSEMSQPSTRTLVKPESYIDSLDESYKPGYSRGKSPSLIRERSGNGRRHRNSSERSPSPMPRKTRRSRSSTPRKNRRSRSSTPRKTLKKRRDSSERSRSSSPRNTYERRRDSRERSRSSTPLKSRRKREDSSDESRRSSRHKRSHKKSHRKKSNRHKHKRIKREKFSPDDSNKSS